MTEKYENVIKKKMRKIIRVKVPKTIGDFLDNLALDIRNYTNRATQLEKDVEKLRWYGFQITDSIQQILIIAKEHNVLKTLRKKEKL